MTELERLRALDGMLLGAWKPVVERKYGPAMWPHLYGRITVGFGGALQRAGLRTPYADDDRETWRMRQVLRVEAAACTWLASVCRGIDDAIAAQRANK
jgi:hypothetical protein